MAAKEEIDSVVSGLDDLFRKLSTEKPNVTMGYSHLKKDGVEAGKVYKGGKVITMKR